MWEINVSVRTHGEGGIILKLILEIVGVKGVGPVAQSV
jgi:hypothetical protein